MTDCSVVGFLFPVVFILAVGLLGVFVLVPVLGVFSRWVERKAAIFFGERDE